ncbi:hypothetical protein [Lacinutrix venerupis]|uniref:YARHG domain-containing protein n=1 Tax=Lacinutrix venerupis TaxID=1486034 RepID=A0AAC9PWB8_9FLAO|nr:hypothetical protein [Lacinutrix venerupis]APX99920.1 hypothetical protein BWR22_06230 [Lacinutrix venerupis]
MKKYILLLIIGFLSVSCNSQNDDIKNIEKKEEDNKTVNEPQGAWKVDKEFDENGNLIRYDSIYSWSSNNTYNNLSSSDRDSLIQYFKSNFFKNFSGFKNNGFDDVFSKDSLFSNYYFNDDFFKSDFGSDFMDIDKIRQQMVKRQKQFLEKYHSEFIKPEDEN